jgi:hypothetical protein
MQMSVRFRSVALGLILALAVSLAPPAGGADAATPAYFGWSGTVRSERWCAARIKDRREIRPDNRPYNHAERQPRSATYPRVTGNFHGSTNEIIQWAACKWGFDENALRAQVAKESYWSQLSLGDWTTDGRNCAPGHGIGRDGRPGECPESVGLMQVRTPYFRDSILGSLRSSAYNLDVALNVWRRCWAGQEKWLNNVEHGRVYRAGDAWGCIGRWFSGRWYTPPSIEYIGAVKSYLRQRIWKTSSFISWRP